MSAEDMNDEFDALFNEVMASGPDKEVVADVPDSPAVVATLAEAAVAVPVPALPETPIPAQPVQAKYKSIPADQKTELPCPACETVVYPLGYVRFKWVNPRFANQAILYVEQIDALEAFFTSPEYKTWKSQAVAAGLRRRGEARKAVDG